MSASDESEPVTHTNSGPVFVWIRRLVNIEPRELRAVAWALLYFFSLLCSYYIVRSLREEMAVQGGVDNLQWMFLGTFLATLAIVPLFGGVSSRFARRQFIPAAYFFVAAATLLFFVLFKIGISRVQVAIAFFIFTSVYNVFIVSVFWSFMADIFSSGQAKRLFGFIAAGGTAGALLGPLIAATLARPLGAINLLPISAGFLVLAIFAVYQLNERSRRDRVQLSDVAAPPTPDHEKPMGGSILSGIWLVFTSPYLLGICLFMLLFTTLATFLYYHQTQIMGDTFTDPDVRTSVFAWMDFSVNALTLIAQLFLTGRIVNRLGVAWTLTLVPVFLVVGFFALGVSPVLSVFVVVQVLRRAGNFAISRPAREMLYTVLDKEKKYKAKNFIDTAIYRGGDALSAAVIQALRIAGLGLSALAYIALPIAALWAWVAFRLGREQAHLAEETGR